MMNVQSLTLERCFHIHVLKRGKFIDYVFFNEGDGEDTLLGLFFLVENHIRHKLQFQAVFLYVI